MRGLFLESQLDSQIGLATTVEIVVMDVTEHEIDRDWHNRDRLIIFERAMLPVFEKEIY